MAINNYIRPMLEVYQQLEVTVQLTGDRMAACIVGADYDLYRYGYEDLQPTAMGTLATTGSQVLALQYSDDPSYEYEVDASSLKLYAEGLLAPTTGDEAVSGFTVDDADPFVLRAPTGKAVAWTTDSIPAGFTAAFGSSTEVEIGDTVAVWTKLSTISLSGMVTLQRSGVVTELVGAPVAAKVSTPSVSVPAHADATTTGTVSDSTVTKDTTFEIAVTNVTDNSVSYRVTDSAGLFTEGSGTATIAQATQVQLGTSGVSASVTFKTGVKKGTAIYVPIYAAHVSTTVFNGVRLSVTPVALSDWETYKTTTVLTAAFKPFTGWLEGVTPTISHDDKGVATSVTWKGKPELKIDGKSLKFVEGIGKLYQQFRVLLIPGETEDVFTITSTEDIQKYFGTISIENDLAYGCAAALEGSAGRAIYALRVRGNTPEAYSAALNKVETNSATYSFAILSEDMRILETAANYVAKRSQPETKKWCRALCGIDSPGAYVAASTGMDGAPIYASVVKLSSTGSSCMLELKADSNGDYNFDFENISLNGSLVTLNEGDYVELTATGAKYKIAAVRSATVLALEDGPADNISNAAIRIWKADTPVNAGEYVSAIAEHFNDRRFTVVFCDKGTASVMNASGVYRTVIIPNKFLAAAVAGLSSAVVPQAPITRTEVPTVTAATRMYTLYTQSMLDDIAKHGVMLITQDTKNQPCYIRHQLTTETDKGSLYYEESCTRNLDNISYSIVDVLERYIGRSNVTPSALRSIMTAVTSALASFTHDSPNDLIGPSLVNWEDLVVEQDPVYKDRVIVRVKLYLPLPLNNIKVYEMAYAADVTLSNN